MDVGAFVQENKRWLLGAAVGGIAWLVASSVIDSVYDADAVRLTAKKAGAPTQLYDGDALAAARKESEEVTAEQNRLKAELAFVVDPKYQLGQGAPDDHLFVVGTALKRAILQGAGERDVLVAEKDVQWDVPSGPDEIRGVLFGLDVMDEVGKRLFAAHDTVRAADPDATGLRAITSLKVESRRTRASGVRAPRTGEVDLRDLLVQEQVMVTFQSDEPTLLAFLESCRKPNRTLAVQAWNVQKPTHRGEPCTVKATVQGIAFKEGK